MPNFLGNCQIWQQPRVDDEPEGRQIGYCPFSLVIHWLDPEIAQFRSDSKVNDWPKKRSKLRSPMSVDVPLIARATFTFFPCFISQHKPTTIDACYYNSTTHLGCLPRSSWVNVSTQRCPLQLSITNMYDMNHSDIRWFGIILLEPLSFCLESLTLVVSNFYHPVSKYLHHPKRTRPPRSEFPGEQMYFRIVKHYWIPFNKLPFQIF